MSTALRRLTILLVFLVVAALLLHKLRDTDIWWHLKTGQDIVENARVPARAIFTYTVPDNRWIDLNWGFQVAAFSVHRLAGVDGLLLLRIFVVLAAFSFLFTIDYSRRSCPISCLVLLLAALVSENGFAVGPGIFSLLFMAVTLRVVTSFKDGRGAGLRALVLLPLIQLMWVNVHGTFVNGLVIIWCYVLGKIFERLFARQGEVISGRAARKLLLIGLVAVLACFINPYGWRVFLNTHGLFFYSGSPAARFMREIAGLTPPLGHGLARSMAGFVMPFGASGDQPWCVFFYKLMIIVSLFSLCCGRRRIKAGGTLTYIVFLFLSLVSRSNLGAFAFVAFPFIVYNFRSCEQLKRILARRGVGSALSISIVVLCCALIGVIASNRYYVREGSGKEFGMGISPHSYPVDSIEFIRERGLAGRPFNTVEEGGYFIWSLYPAMEDFIDGRLDMFGSDFIEDYSYVLRYPHEGMWNMTVDRFGITLGLIGHSLRCNDALIGDLVSREDWALVYIGRNATVFLKDAPRNSEAIERHKIDLRDFARAYSGGGGAGSASFDSPFCIWLSRRSTLGASVVEFLNAYPRKVDFPRGELARGDLFRALDLFEPARVEYKQAIEKYPCSSLSRNRLGMLYFRSARYDEAVGEFEKALECDRSDSEARRNLGISMRRAGDLRAGSERVKMLIGESFDTDNPAHRHMALGYRYLDEGLIDLAIGELKRSVDLDPGIVHSRTALARAYAGKIMLDEAIAHCEAALTLDPRNPDAHMGLAVIYHRKELPDEAERAYMKALCYGGFEKALFYLDRYGNERLYEGTVKHLKYRIRSSPRDPAGYVDLGDLLYQKKEYEDASRRFKKALKINPGLVEVRCKLGLSYMKKGEYEKAESELERCLEAEPDLRTARDALEKIRGERAGRRH